LAKAGASVSSDIIFTKAYPAAHQPMPADRGALGYIPVSALQYCEALRVASGLGWYLFPPRTISLMFDGRETFVADQGQWRTFTHEPLAQDFQDHWNAHAPPHLRGHAPSYLRRLSDPGVVQIWTGYFVETAPELWLHIRPIVNKYDVSGYACYEAIVETDHFRPAALFMNIRLLRTDSEILIEKDMPFFQVSAVEKASIRRQYATIRGLDALPDDQDTPNKNGFWDGMNATLRIAGVTPARSTIGEYGAASRKRAKSGP
jgi:hypothetical protein